MTINVHMASAAKEKDSQEASSVKKHEKTRAIREEAELISFEFLLKNKLKNKLKVEDALESASRELKLVVMNIVGTEVSKLEDWESVVYQIRKLEKKEKKKYEKKLKKQLEKWGWKD